MNFRPATDSNDGDVVATFDVEPAAGGVYSAFAVEIVADRAAREEGDGDHEGKNEHSEGDY